MRDSAIARTMSMLAFIGRSPEPVTAQRICKSTGMSRATVYRAVEELADHGWLIVSGGSPRRYRPSLRVADLGLAVLSQARPPAVVLRCLCDLARELNRVCMFSVYEDGDIVVTDVADIRGAHSVSPTAEMLRVPAAVSGAGKALLSHQGEAEIEAVVAKGLPPFAPRTKTAPEAIRAEIDATRVRGYGLTEDEHEQVSGAGCPVFDKTGRAIGALGVYGQPLSDPSFVEEVVPRMLHYAREASAQLGFRVRANRQAT